MFNSWQVVRRVAIALIVVAACLRSGKQISNIDDGFRISKISSTLTYHPEWEVESSLSPTNQTRIFEQKYHYLGKGAQVFAFISDDGNYVLKFFKHQHLRLISWPDKIWLPTAIRARFDVRNQRRQQKLHEHFRSYKIAYEQLRQETGLIYLHLNKTECLKRHLTIVTRNGWEHTLELDQMEFLVQQRAELIYPHLTALMDRGEADQAILVVGQVIALMRTYVAQGIIDTDPAFGQNYGIVGDHVVQIDVGRFIHGTTKTPSPVQLKQQLEKSTYHFRLWLVNHYPELETTLDLWGAASWGSAPNPAKEASPLGTPM